MFSTKKPGAFRVTRSRSLRPSCRLPRPGPGGFRPLCGTERWSRVVSAHFRLVWAPFRGSTKIGGRRAFVKTTLWSDSRSQGAWAPRHHTTRLGGRRRGRDVLYRNDPISIRVEGPIERVDRHPRGRIETLSRAICSRSPPSPAPRTPPDLPLPASSPPPACGPPRCLLPPPAPR